MKIYWVAVSGPGVYRMAMWHQGKTKQIFVTGLTREFVANAPGSIELPPEAVVYAERPVGQLFYTFTVFEDK